MTGERTRITFNAGAWRFNYRVGGVIVRDGHVLLMRIGSENFWSFWAVESKLRSRRRQRSNAK